MKEYRLHFNYKNPVIISAVVFDSLKNQGVKFGKEGTNRTIDLGDIGFNARDVLYWEPVELDPVAPRGWEEEQVTLSPDGIRVLRLIYAAHLGFIPSSLGMDERAEVLERIKEYKARKQTNEHKRRSLFNSLHFDVFIPDNERESRYKRWCKSDEAAKMVVEEQVQEIKEIFNAEEITPEAQLSTGEAEVQRVKQILTEMKTDDDFVSPF